MAAISFSTYAQCKGNWRNIAVWSIPFVAGTSALLFGGAAGIFSWSFKLPNHVIAAAEMAAHGRPYCIEAVSRPVHSKFELLAINMFSPPNRDYTLKFHSVLRIKNNHDIIYMNWSYRLGKYELIEEGTWRGMMLDAAPRCTPTHDFGRRLLYIGGILG